MAVVNHKVDINLIVGLVVFLVCFVLGLIFWDWHHEKELTRTIEHHRALGRAGCFGNPAGGSTGGVLPNPVQPVNFAVQYPAQGLQQQFPTQSVQMQNPG
ncbi:MAG: hypothetical protein HQM08_08660 [Candidatus Riflebacteria bacterium]|nr:hypothetical protein [Candidatus Riflebacteria bacterium]